jgi:hypothetical protein
MACEKFKELVECVNTEINKTIKEYEDIKLGYLLYESWINALNDNITEGDFTPQLCNGSWLYVDFPFQSKRDNFGINIRIQLRINDGKPTATFCDSSHLITFPSKTKINKVNIKRTYPELIKYYDLIIQESVVAEEMFFKEKTFFDVESLIKFLKIIKESVKNENYALLKAYFDDERTEKALREITEC